MIASALGRTLLVATKGALLCTPYCAKKRYKKRGWDTAQAVQKHEACENNVSEGNIGARRSAVPHYHAC